jgi:exodeoxyribonuclease-3
MKLISWNVNGLRAAEKKGFIKWLHKEKPDIIGLQEIKGHEHQFSKELLAPDHYHAYFNPAQRKGYSGTAIYTKIQPREILNGFGVERFDSEGRTQIVDYGDFVFINIYFPNGQRDEERLNYKLEFYDEALKYFDKCVKEGKKLFITGDYNTAHKEIDLARPKENEMTSGFLPIERRWLDKLIDHGFIDCFREFNKTPECYTWWSMRGGARYRNVGWRIDYFFCSKNARSMVKDCYHLPEIMGSDHCPVVLFITE